MNIFQKLNESFPPTNVGVLRKHAFFLGLFVFLFLSFFQPFGLQSNEILPLLKVAFIYGLITAFTMIFIRFISDMAFPKFNAEKNWTLGKEILITLVNFVCIGMANLLYSKYAFNLNISWQTILLFQAYTLGVGVFPVTFFLLNNFNKLTKKNLDQAKDFSENFASNIKSENKSTAEITLFSDLKNDDLKLSLGDFLFAESADNYVEVFYLVNENISKKLLRTSLQQIESSLAEFEHIIRTHRSFLTNMQWVNDFSGNAQGLKLKIAKGNLEVPVSRKMVKSVRDYYTKENGRA